MSPRRRVLRPSRREALALGVAGLAALGSPRRGRAAVRDADRRFLFVFCEGGWDTTKVFTPTLDSPDIPDEDGAFVDTIGGIDYVAHEARSSVTRFLRDHGDRTLFVNGFEVRSIAHARCRQLLFTGSAESGTDDWPATLAAAAADRPLLPCLVASGPTYATAHASAVVRLGETGQLSGLLDGTALTHADRPVAPPGDDLDALLDAHARERAVAAVNAAGDARAAHVAARRLDALDDLADLVEISDGVDLSVDPSRSFQSAVQPVLDGLELGLARCGVLQHRGVNDSGWDTHNANDMHQSGHFSLLFGDLMLLMADLDARSGPAGGRLSDETTVVVLSEMGRAPWINLHDGKDHWTWTSAILIGGGVRGDRVLGGIDGAGVGLPVDPTTGAPSGSGQRLTSAHLGASLLALGGVDPGPILPGVTPLDLT